ncbi:MAG: AAA family ATPase [Candidatus Micrarchaeota archaeon]|nr:AAA family ATPase [Candidatus Micrarchaeota archaeon]MDE1804657.1 AAA family ATPase [Candidatus Micrarchaeota archaeon]MDE1846863.1 AAA family ATPase [Candidatus Micrarchaeota archaeon]
MADQEQDSVPKKGTANPAARESYTKAGTLFEDNKFEEAIELYSQAIKQDPMYASAYFNRALAYAIINKYDQATEDAQQVLRIEPESYDAPYVMGIIAEYKKDFDSAKEWYLRALKQNPKYEQARARLEGLTKKAGEGPTDSSDKVRVATEKNETVVQEGQLKQVKWHKSLVTFKDVVGMKKEKKLIYENIILAIKKPELLKAYGKKLGLGVLFYGPPGCGKTYFVNAIGGETQSKVIIAAINEIIDMYAGNTEKNLHAIFEQARKNTPCVIFFDEVDAMGSKRDGGGDGGGSQNFMRMAVNQFLQEMDGVEKNPEGIFIIGATNAPWDMDPALKRSGRFGEAIYIPPPDYATRKQSFIYHTRKMPLSRINFGRLARATIGFSQADIAEICDRAALIPAAEEDRTGRKRKLRMNDFFAVIKAHGGTLDEWYSMVRKDIVNKTETTVVDGKKQEVVKEGKLSPEEKNKYKALVKDVKRNSSAYMKFIKKMIRNFSIYIT